MSGRISWTIVAIWGVPAESRTTPETVAVDAPWRGSETRPVSTTNNARWTLRNITDRGDLAASLAHAKNFTPARARGLRPVCPNCAALCILFHDKRRRLRNLLF